MNLTMTECDATAAQLLKDKVSLVTGSTSGIGLGVARTLAGAGSAVVLGFGKPEDIEAALAGIASDFGVRSDNAGYYSTARLRKDVRGPGRLQPAQQG